jgi:hypothetical protein
LITPKTEPLLFLPEPEFILFTSAMCLFFGYLIEPLFLRSSVLL